MNDSWNPQISQKYPNKFPDHILQFFHNILALVENERELTDYEYNWKALNQLKNDMIIESDGKEEDKKIHIPRQIRIGSIYFKESNSKAKGLLINLRHAFAHDYIEVHTSNNAEIVKIALPQNSDNTKFKLVCFLTFSDLVKVVDKILSSKKKTQQKSKSNNCK